MRSWPTCEPSHRRSVQVRVVASVPADELTLASRCDGWSVGDVLEHSIGVTRKFTDFASGSTDEPHAPTSAPLLPDHSTALRQVAVDSAAAWRPADMTRHCRLRFGTFPAEVAAGINLFDVLAHTWDIAATVELDLDGDDEVWTVALKAAQQVIGVERDVAHYGPAVTAAGTASTMVRFLAFLGRRHS